MDLNLNLNASPLPQDNPLILQPERQHRIEKRKRDHYQQQVYAPTRSHAHRRNQPPQGWIDCPPFGQCLGPLIPSKVPLDETYNDYVVPGKRYSVEKLVNKQRNACREIGLVLDLTNTTRYYDTREWEDRGIKHCKIPCKGKDSVPDAKSVNTFVYEVMEFLKWQKHSKNPKFILVHCTHGHNRTGFMIVHFLMRSQMTSVAEALNLFAEKRPPGIYKPDYIQALYNFYYECPENIVYPPTPEWKHTSEFNLNGEAMHDDDDHGGNSSLLSFEPVENKNITSDDVLGDDVPYKQLKELREMCYHLLVLTLPQRGYLQFPGSHPVSLNRDNLQLLRQRYYYTTWKADGTRYMMLILRHGCYLIDRNFSFRRVQMRFPLKNIHKGFHDMTLIDGEMIIDKIPDVGLKRRYLAYDLMALNGSSKVKLPFSERWKLLEEEIVRPRNYERKHLEVGGRVNHFYRYDMELFGVRRKDFWLLSTVMKLLKEFIPQLSHEADGLIFQDWDDPYVCRTHEGLLKWKYPEMNSVDFLFEIGSENQQLLFLCDNRKKKLMDEDRVKFEDFEDTSALSGKIVECSWDSNEECWVCMRIRTDRATPNGVNTYRKVLRSIEDNITQEVLLGDISEIVALPMYADRMIQQKHQRG